MLLEKIVVGPLAVNCYLIGCKKTKQAAVIDPGDEFDNIQAVINKNPWSLKYILLTHAHVDHITQIKSLKNANSAEVLLHSDDHFLLDSLSTQAAMFGLPDPGNPTIDRFIKDGDDIQIGDLNIHVLHTPGHSPGGVTFHIDNYLFVGDLIFAGSIGRTDLPGGNYDTLIRSVQTKIFTLPDSSIICPGHGPETTAGQEKAFNPFFR